MLRAAPSKESPLVVKTSLYLAILISSIALTGCAAPLAALSSSSTAAASSVGAVAVANPATSISIASTATTGKSPLEHAASAATKKECNFLNMVNSQPFCIDVVLPPITDKSEPLLGPADQEMGSVKQ